MRLLGGGRVGVALRMGWLKEPKEAANIPDLLWLVTKPSTIFVTRGLRGAKTWAWYHSCVVSRQASRVLIH